MSQQLDEAQSIKKRVDVHTKVLTRNCLDRVYLNTADNVHAMDEVKDEFKRIGSIAQKNQVVAEINQNMMEMTTLNHLLNQEAKQDDLQHIRNQMSCFGRIRNPKQ